MIMRVMQLCLSIIMIITPWKEPLTIKPKLLNKGIQTSSLKFEGNYSHSKMVKCLNYYAYNSWQWCAYPHPWYLKIPRNDSSSIKPLEENTQRKVVRQLVLKFYVNNFEAQGQHICICNVRNSVSLSHPIFLYVTLF